MNHDRTLVTTRALSRRLFLQASAATVGAAALAGVLPRTLLAQAAPAALQVTSPNPTPDGQATVLVDDVLDFRLRGDFAWNGGWVRFRLHEGRIDGEPIWFIRTDASDRTFAADEGLVFVPLLALARSVEGGSGRVYLFDDGSPAGVLDRPRPRRLHAALRGRQRQRRERFARFGGCRSRPRPHPARSRSKRRRWWSTTRPSSGLAGSCRWTRWWSCRWPTGRCWRRRTRPPARSPSSCTSATRRAATSSPTPRPYRWRR